jgi:hypothetical protein
MPVAVASCNGTDTAAAVGRSDARARRPPTHRPRHQQPDRPSLIKRRPPSPAAAPAPRHGRATPHRGSPWSRTSAVHRAPSPSSHAPRKKTGHGPTIRPDGQTPGLPTRRAFKRGRHRRKRWGRRPLACRRPDSLMQHLHRLVTVVKHPASTANDAQPLADADCHWHTVPCGRSCAALPGDDLVYFLRRPQLMARHAAPSAPIAVPDPTARAVAAAFAN